MQNTIEIKIKGLEAKIDHLKNKVEIWKHRYHDEMSENATLLQKNSDLRRKNSDLRWSVQCLEARVERFESEGIYKMLTANCDFQREQHEHHVDQLVEKIRDLKVELDIFKQERC